MAALRPLLARSSNRSTTALLGLRLPLPLPLRRSPPGTSTPRHPTSLRPLHTSRALRSSSSNDSHESRFDPPTGNLFNVRPGEKYEEEGWETVWYWGFGGCMLVLVVGYIFKPDTSIQTWALEEARRRLEREGILTDAEGRPLT